MKKRSVKIIVLLILLVAVSAAAFGISRYQTEQEAIREAGDTILSIATEDVTSLSWENESGEYAFTKDEEGWKYEDDEEFPVSTEKIEDMLGIFNEFGAAFIIEAVTDYDQYGLEDPIATIHIGMADETYDISLGDYSQMDEQRYVSIGDGNAYLAVDDPLDEFDAVSDDLIANDSIPSFGTPIVSMDISISNDFYTIFYEEDSPLSYDADDIYFAQSDDNEQDEPLSPSLVSSYLTALRSTELTNFVNYKVTDEELADYGLDSPDLKLEVWYTSEDEDGIETSESFSLSIARDPEEAAAASETETDAASETSDEASADGDEEEEITAYARYGDSSIIYQITGDEYETLMAANYDDFRHTEVMTASQDEMTGIDITLEDTTYTLTTDTGTDEAETADGSETGGETEATAETQEDTEAVWTFNGEETDPSDLISEILAARITEFADDAPSDREEISLTIYLKDENFPEVNIVFYRNDGSTCLAQIDGESVGYVSRSDVVDIIEAVNAIVLE